MIVAASWRDVCSSTVSRIVVVASRASKFRESKRDRPDSERRRINHALLADRVFAPPQFLPNSSQLPNSILLRLHWLLVCAGTVFTLSCTSANSSNTARTATEQMLISNAVDHSLSKVDFQVFRG